MKISSVLIALLCWACAVVFFFKGCSSEEKDLNVYHGTISSLAEDYMDGDAYNLRVYLNECPEENFQVRSFEDCRNRKVLKEGDSVAVFQLTGSSFVLVTNNKNFVATGTEGIIEAMEKDEKEMNYIISFVMTLVALILSFSIFRD